MQPDEMIEVMILIGLRLFQIILMWGLFSLGLSRILKKLGEKHRWMVCIPGWRYYMFGRSLNRPTEGIVTGALEVLFIILGFLPEGAEGSSWALIRDLLMLIVYITLYIYRIRLFLRLTEVCRAKKRWILVWLLWDALAMMIFGFSKKLQPVSQNDLGETELAGTEPSVIDSAKTQYKAQSLSGLSIDLKARTVRDYGKKRYLLRNIRIEIPNGSLVMLLGGSGAGKTTLMNAVIGYEKADATILLNGSDIYEDYNNLKYRIGFVPQQNLMRGNDTVLHTVGDSAEMRLPAAESRKARFTKIDEVLDLLGLSAGSGGLVCKKSGGQLRRIAIAQELVSDPELFVLDEPDSGLDGAIAHEIFTKLRAIADTGKIIIVITHTPDRVIDLFDKVIVLAKDSDRVGRLAFYGSPKEAREFFGRDTMEEIVVAINRTEEGGEGLADRFIEQYAAAAAEREGGAIHE